MILCLIYDRAGVEMGEDRSERWARVWEGEEWRKPAHERKWNLIFQTLPLPNLHVLGSKSVYGFRFFFFFFFLVWVQMHVCCVYWMTNCIPEAKHSWPVTLLTLSLCSSVWQGRFSPPESACSTGLTVFEQPPYTITCINICAHIKNPKLWHPYHFYLSFCHREILVWVPQYGILMWHCWYGCCILTKVRQPSFLQKTACTTVIRQGTQQSVLQL